MYIRELFETSTQASAVLYYGTSFVRAIGAMMDNSIHGPSENVQLFTKVQDAKQQALDAVKDHHNFYGAIGSIAMKIENELPPVGVIFELNGYRLTKGYHLHAMSLGTYGIQGDIHELRTFIEHLDYPKTVAAEFIRRLEEEAAALGEDYAAQRFIRTAKDFMGSISEAYDHDKEREHFDALHKTGFFGAQGAGCVIIAKDTGRMLLNHRSRMVEQPGTWGNWGGAMDDPNGNPAEEARREVTEEAGYHGPVEMYPAFVFEKGTFRYSNFIAVVEEEFTPHLDWESQGYEWCEWGHFPQPLHFGLVALFNDPASVQLIEKIIAAAKNQ